MSSLYDKRFGDDTETFRFWVDSFIDFLEEDLNDNHVNEDRDVIDSMWANDLIERLSSFPTNKYLIVFIKSLKRWII